MLSIMEKLRPTMEECLRGHLGVAFDAEDIIQRGMKHLASKNRYPMSRRVRLTTYALSSGPCAEAGVYITRVYSTSSSRPKKVRTRSISSSLG